MSSQSEVGRDSTFQEKIREKSYEFEDKSEEKFQETLMCPKTKWTLIVVLIVT